MLPLNQAENCTFFQVFKLKIKNKLQARQKDQLLFPENMGPHYLFTLTSPDQNPQVCNINQQLETSLSQKFTEYLGYQSFPSFSPKLSQKNTFKELQKSELSQNSQIQGISQNKKYKKYSCAFKKRIISQIQQEMLEGEQNFPKKKRYDEEKKMRYLAKHKSVQYGIHPKNILRWVQTREQIQNQSGRKPKFPELEEQLIGFVKRNSQAKRRDIISEAKNIMKRMDIKVKFLFSKGWYERFKARYMKKITIQNNKSRQETTAKPIKQLQYLNKKDSLQIMDSQVELSNFDNFSNSDLDLSFENFLNFGHKK